MSASDPHFRYPNDNREKDIQTYIYPSQNHPVPESTKGQAGYYPNDNSGQFANSNREYSIVDTIKHPPNSNWPTGGMPYL